MTLGLFVGVAGAVGAVLRFALDAWLQRRSGSSVPVGTLGVNLSGAFVLGVVTGLIDQRVAGPHVGTVLSAGLLGGYTTFSTFTFESIRLAEESAWRPLTLYLAASVGGGLAAAAVGLWVGGLI